MIRIRTTGGGGWGDPLDRDPALVVRDVVWRKVSPEAALADYGVVLTGSLDDDSARVRRGRDGHRARRPAGRQRGLLRPRPGLRAPRRRGGVRRRGPAGLTHRFVRDRTAATDPSGSLTNRCSYSGSLPLSSPSR